jgi:hypothetical protein
MGPAYDGEWGYYDGEYYTPTLRLPMWHAFADKRGLRERERESVPRT